MQLFSNIYEQREKELDERHQKVMTQLQQQSDMALNLAGQNAIRRGIIEQDLFRKKAELEKKHEAEKEELARKQKRFAVAEAIMNTYRSAMGAAADTRGGPVMRTLSAGAMVAFGMQQVKMIQAQKLWDGGMVRRDGRGNSDLVPTMLSEGEVVTKRSTVERLGGEQGFSQLLKDSLTRQSRSGGDVHYHIGQLYGSKEYVRGMFKEINKEKESWQY